MPFQEQELAKFGKAGQAIADAVGETFEAWAMGEAGIVLKQWATHVPEALPDKARMRSRGRARKKSGLDSLAKFSTTANTGRFGGQIGLLWFKSRKGKWRKVGVVADDGSLQQPHTHYGAQEWAKISGAQAAYAGVLPGLVNAGQAAIGLARQSVIQIADSLGIRLENVQGGGGGSVDFARARAARASDGNQYINGTSTITRGKGSFAVTLIDTYPAIEEAKIDQALELVVAQRMAFHESNLDMAMAKDLRGLQKAYPYFEVTNQ